ncbi:polyketide synthase [Streptomyces yaizuensis]|uniref:Type I polyketide synthase n=1 Tax=Streptomyces yaizuensis TaxID=2989713 RepID=A0ABQ5NRN8_9ACTN|nr:polyketide synthase [Streptomyces sp. YSPA8]GLF93019.1 type I polyketide synthase [Streptomyces sp. YSPA8]
MTDRSPADAPPEPLAIIGIGCRFPGGATTPAAFWDLLCAGVDATGELPRDRWDAGKFYDPDPAKLGKTNTVRGGFLDRIDTFDAPFFGIAPREAIWLDPQQRLLLQAAWEALEDGGQVAARLAGSDTGVFMGGFTLDYQLLQNYGVHSRYELQSHSATGMMMTMLANRLSYVFDFRGPSLAVDTACSGSLVAVHLAARSLWSGECSLALAGGVNVMIAPNMTIAESKGGFLAPDGRCKAFDASADGYARGEGVGVVLLKPLSRALADRDRVHALIRGTAVSQDGHSNGITVPNGDAQEAAIRAACRQAGIAPHEVQYVEAHGTGTPVGDPVEAGAIGRVFSEGRPADRPLVIGSVKTNIGHLEAAAGVAGLIKTALALEHGRIPGQLHHRTPNPAIDFEGLRLRVQTRPGDWPEAAGPRHAGVNSFGFGGTNAHVVLEEPPAAREPAPTAPQRRRYLVPLSARAPEALADLAASLSDALSGAPDDLRDIGWTRALRRDHHDHRLAVVAGTAAEAAARLRAFAAGDEPRGVTAGHVPAKERPKLAFVCSGMGPQWWAMARRLLESEPVFHAAVRRCDRELAQHTGWSLLAELLAPEEESRMAETEVAQPANFAVQVGLAELWRSFGIEPDGVVGHSTGEVAAQYLAGVLRFEDAIRVTYYRSSLQQRATGTGRMLAVGMTPETLNQAVADAGPLVSVAAVNSPTAVTLSGDAGILRSMADQLETFGVFHRFLTVKVPYHSHCMDPLREDLEKGLADIRPAVATLPLYSTVTGTRVDGRGADARYWWQNVRATVLFAAAFRQMLADGYTHFVELGPHPVLAGSMRELLAEQRQEGLVVPSLRRDEPDDDVLLGSLGALYSHGHDVDWTVFYGEGARLVDLPPYPWQLKRYWNESAEAREDRHSAAVHPLLGQPMNATHPTWEREITPRLLPFLADHRVQGNTVLPGAAFVELALAAAHEVYGEGDYTLDALELRKALVLPATADPRLRTTLHQETGRVEFAGFAASPGGARTWTLHASARLVRRPPDRVARDLADARARCGQRVSHDAFYDLVERMGFQYGPAFRTVQETATGPGRAVGRVTVPDSVREDLGSYRFHPSLIDAAFQVLLTSAAPRETDAAPTFGPYLPVGIDSISVLGRPADEMHVVAEVVTADARVIVSDLALCDAGGRVLVDIRGFRAQSLDTAAGLTPERIDQGLYEVQWHPAPTGGGTEPDDPQALWVLFTGAGGVGAETAALLTRAGHRVVTVAPGPVPEPVGTPADGYVLDPTRPEHYREVLGELAHGGGIGGVVHLWGLDLPFTEDMPVTALEDGQDRGALSVLHLMQALAAQVTRRLPRVWLVTRRAQAVGAAPGPLALPQSPIWGIGRVIGHQEFTGLWGGMIDLDAGPDAEEARRLVHEITARDGEDQIAYRDGQRHVARLARSDSLAPPFPLALRDDVTYLVTGGTGALGRLVAAFLADRGARHLVLMSRTPPPPPDTWRTLPADHAQRDLVDDLLRWEARGIRVHCAAVDCADEARLHAWSAEHRRLGRPPVGGVVHAAGVVEDELMPRMGRDTFRRVLRPKLNSGWLLHRLFAGTPLEFFVLFGSVGSVIASAGQANYASANAFLDALAHHRRSLGLPALSIGWGPWSVGMVEKLGLEQMYARRGIELITPEAGARILGRLIGQRPAQVVAITADWASARSASPGAQLPPMFGDLGAADADHPAQTATDAAAGADAVLAALRRTPEPDRPDALAAHLHAIAALVLKLDPADFGDDANLSGLGIDSLMAVEIKYRVEATLRADISVLDLLQGVTVRDLAARILPLIVLAEPGAPAEPGGSPPGDPSETTATGADTPGGEAPGDELAALLAQVPPDELERLLDELEADPPRTRRE